MDQPNQTNCSSAQITTASALPVFHARTQVTVTPGLSVSQPHSLSWGFPRVNRFSNSVVLGNNANPLFSLICPTFPRQDRLKRRSGQFVSNASFGAESRCGTSTAHFAPEVVGPRSGGDQAIAEEQLIRDLYLKASRAARRGGKLDFAEAADCFRLAADNGFARAQLEYGVCLWAGKGVTMDCVRAAQYFNSTIPSVCSRWLNTHSAELGAYTLFIWLFDCCRFDGHVVVFLSFYLFPSSFYFIILRLLRGLLADEISGAGNAGRVADL
jgi:hypothetical protein